MKIELFQNLYSTYSKLALSFASDRPSAIRGLERRLLDTLQTEGGYGMFERYLHRFLLWQRSGSSLKRITKFRGDIPPSWSWMAYEGAIKYLSAPYGMVEWSKDIQSPFTNTYSSKVRDPAITLQLKAPIHDVLNPRGADFILDDTNMDAERQLKCIIVGTSKDAINIDQAVCYVLLVSKATDQSLSTYERVGAACLKTSQIALDSSSALVYIQ